MSFLPEMPFATVAQRLKHLPGMLETWVQFLGREDPWRRKWQPTPVLLPGESHGRRSLVGYSPWGRKESDMTERLHTLVSKEIYSPALQSQTLMRLSRLLLYCS